MRYEIKIQKTHAVRHREEGSFYPPSTAWHAFFIRQCNDV